MMHLNDTTSRCLIIFRRRYYLLWIVSSCMLFVIYYRISFAYYGREATYKIKIFHWPKLKNNVSCHFLVEGDALPSVEDPSFSPGNKSIFFHETSCRGGINSHQACAVESAARLHPNWQINLLFNGPVTKLILRRSILVALSQLLNVKFARVHIQEYCKGTILESMVSNQLKNSLHPIEHTADILRILTLHKFGGVYLDTDAILIRSLAFLPENWIAKESDRHVGSGIMAISRHGVGANFTRDVMTEINNTFTPQSWSRNGPQALQRVLRRHCPDALLTDGNCDGIEIYSADFFYPLPFNLNTKYFKNGDLDNVEDVYMHHVWNRLSSVLHVEKNSPYAKLAKKFCPTTYKEYGDIFGV